MKRKYYYMINENDIIFFFFNMKQRISFPSFSTKKDEKAQNPSKVILKFLKDNSEWTSIGSMIGTISDSKIVCKKSKGPQKFILYQQNRDNSFAFPLIEAASLFFSRKLIILSLSPENNIFAPSAHFISHALFKNNVTFHELKMYSLFNRFSASSRKPIEIESMEKKKEIKKSGFSELLQDSIGNGPKESSFEFTDVFPITQLIKIPSDHKTPDNFAISFSGIRPNSQLKNRYTCIPINFKCLVSVQNGPKINPLVSNFA